MRVLHEAPTLQQGRCHLPQTAVGVTGRLLLEGKPLSRSRGEGKTTKNVAAALEEYFIRRPSTSQWIEDGAATIRAMHSMLWSLDPRSA
jgi:hypothetical protein